MHHVSLLIEFLRGRPSLVFWTVALAQAAIWTVVPSIFYSAPPADVPLLLAIGHEFLLGSYLGPPLSFWLGEAAFRIGGIVGVYALAQACIVVTYWAVFTLGRRIVGTRHAVLAVLLMAGTAVFTVPSPNFGEAVLAAPLVALALLHYWRAVGDGERGYWFLLGVDLGLLLLASYVGLILFALLIVFTLAHPRGRRALLASEPWFGLVLTAIVVFPHAAWLARMGQLVLGGLEDTRVAGDQSGAGGQPRRHHSLHPARPRAIGDRRERRAAQAARTSAGNRRGRPSKVSAALMSMLSLWRRLWSRLRVVLASGYVGQLERIAPLVVLSGLAAIVAAGDSIELYRERTLSFAWLGLLTAPPALIVVGIVLLPWISKTELPITQPANAWGSFYGDIFERRTGKPLAYISGDPKLAPLVAMAAPSRPHVYFAWAPQRSPWASADDIRKNGGVLVWPALDIAGTPPATIKAQFPDIVPEVPRSFERTVQGFLPLIRLGWAVIRPAP